MANDIKYYHHLLSHMKYSNRGGYKAPHKAVYLLSIIKLIEIGQISENRFHITQTLVNRFEYNWKRYVGNNPHFQINVWNPIYYMEQDVIQNKVRPGFEHIKPASIERCQQVFEFLEIPMDLWALLQDNNYRKDFRLLLIDTYLIKNRTKSHSALLQLAPLIVNTFYLFAI